MKFTPGWNNRAVSARRVVGHGKYISASANSSAPTAAAAHGLDAENAERRNRDRLKARAIELGVPDLIENDRR